MMKVGVLIQARTGSTRLPQKITMPFYEGNTLLDIIIERVKKSGELVVLATTTSTSDAGLEQIAKKHGVGFYAGDEHNVLRRFVEAASIHKLDVVIRVCADNPFIHSGYIQELLAEYQKHPKNYISFFTKNDVPVIKTHYGFFMELVELEALKKVEQLTNEKLYLEHVTNYIYAHPEQFSIGKLTIPFEEPSKLIRLTIDTEEDFKLAASLYHKFKDALPEELIAFLLQHPEMLTSMEQQVIVNSK